MKIPKDLKQESQNSSCVDQPLIEEEDKNEIVDTLNAVSISEQITPEKWKRSSRKTQSLSGHIRSSQQGKSQNHQP